MSKVFFDKFLEILMSGLQKLGIRKDAPPGVLKKTNAVRNF